ncbi:MAG: tetratricopeptide repeat protein [Methanolinea sp.]|nr:tetratricopeptide repeat protein [Methanolinea sp.]
MGSEGTAWKNGRIVLFLAAAAFLLVPAIPVHADSPAEVANALMRRADDLVVQGRPLEALTLYEEAITLDPYSTQLWNRLGLTQMKVGRYPDAQISFQKALDMDPYYTAAWKNKGDALAAQEQFQAAIDAYDRALAINANDIYTLYEKGVCLQKMGKTEKAMEAYTEVVRLAEREVRKNPNEARYNAQLWTTKGDALARLGRYREAMEAYGAALEINPKMERAARGIEAVNETLYRGRGSPELLQTPALPEKTTQARSAIPLSPFPALLAPGLLALALWCARSLQRKS